MYKWSRGVTWVKVYPSILTTCQCKPVKIKEKDVKMRKLAIG